MGVPIVVCSDCGLDWALHDANPEWGELRRCQPDICLRLLKAEVAQLRADVPGTRPCCGAPEHRVVDLLGAGHPRRWQEGYGVQS